MEFFFGKQIDPDQEKQVINSVLKKYRNERATEDLKKKIYDELVTLKFEGKISIPFQVALREDKFNPFIEILLDTKV
ncbi:MAG: hypothetical protein S4CHLAM81_01370 [Chlamydiales bacterium]|nr:hypothetical protein [Chlamydiales bacterium]MCH9634933.1 hypothetical protein [Chlamydiales bacterium]